MRVIRWLACALALATIGLLVLRSGPPVAAGATLVVDDDGYGSATDCDATDAAYSTISAAVSAAASDDTVLVCPGTYNEQVVIDTANLTLNGPNAGVDPGCSGTRPNSEATIAWSTLTTVGTASTVVIAANGVTVDGFTIQNTNGTQNQVSVLIGGHYVGDTHPSDGSNVRNNIISSGYNNVYVWQSSDSTIERNRVLASVETQISIRDNAGQGTRDALRNSVLDNCIDKAGVASLGHSVAIGVTGGGAQDFTGTLIQGNTMKNSGAGTGHYRGIDANLANGTVAEPVKIYGNTITDTSEQGIRVESSNNYDIGGSSSSTGNTITGSRGAVGGYRRGITTAGTSTGLSIQYNTISGHSSTSGNDGEIVVTTAGNTILHNTLFVADSLPTGVGGVGLRADSPSNVLGENTFQGNGQRMLVVSGAPGPGLTVVDATASTFKTAAGTTLDPNSQADLVSIEDRVRHHLDVPSNLVLLIFKANTTVATALNNATTPGAIQRAVNAVPGSTVIVGPGTYTETGQIVINKNLSIAGAGASTTVVKPAGDTGSSGDARGWFLVNSGVTFNLSGVTLDGTGRNIHQAIRHKGAGTISDCVFSNIKYPGYNGVGIAVMGPAGMNVDVMNCTFTEIGRIGVIYFGAGVTGTFSGNTYTGKGSGDWLDYGVEVGGGAHATITSSTISDCLGVASSDGSVSGGILVSTLYGAGTQASITGNTFTSNYWGIGVGYGPTDTSVVVAHYNNISGNTHLGLRSSNPNVDATDNWWGSANGPTHASNTFNVGAQGDVVSDNVDFVPWLDGPPSTGNSFAPVTTTSPVGSYASIQAGVDASNPGGTVNAKTGVFSEKVTVNKPVTVQAASSPVVDCGGPGNGFAPSANNVTINGFEIRNCSNGIEGQTSNSTISNNVIHNNLNYGGSQGVGILLWGDNDNNQISGNTVYNNDRQGIFIGHCDFAGPDWACTAGGTLVSSGNTISGNVIHDNGRYTQPNGPDASQYGIQLWNGDGNEVKLNEIWNHKGFGFGIGVYLCNADSNDVHDNTVHDNQYNIAAYGCEGSSGGNNIHLNTLSAPTDSNVRLFAGSPSTTVNDNTMSGGVYGVRASPGNTGTAVTANDILGFKQNGVRIDGSSDADVSTNDIDGQGACNSSYTAGSSPETDTRCYGVEWIDATGTISGNTITGVKVGAGTGAQTGVGIRASARATKTTTVTIDHNVVSDYQKNGMAITGQYGGTVSATVDTNTVTGWGPTGVIAQNGIQTGYGAATAIDGNTVSGNSYTGSYWAAANVLVSSADTDVTGNSLTDGQVSLYYVEGSGTIGGNTISATTVGVGRPAYWGIVVSDPPAARPSPYEDAPESEQAGSMTDMTLGSGVMTVLVEHNTITGDGSADSVGLEADSGFYGSEDIDLTASYNEISNWGYGVVTYACTGCYTDSAFLSVDVGPMNNIADNDVGVGVYNDSSAVAVNFNYIVGNTSFGVESDDTANILDATNNWWGACDGPGPVGPGSGDKVSDYVDYDPWLSGACDYDGDKLSDDQERWYIGTDWRNPDTDGDGCDDGQEYVSMPGFDPRAPYWYDFYDVPVPAKPDMTPNGPRDQAIAMDDVLAVLFYVGAFDGDGGAPNPNGVAYDRVKGSCDWNADTVPDKEGFCYDRSAGPLPNPPWEASPPDGAVSMDDVLAVLAQVGLDCTG